MFRKKGFTLIELLVVIAIIGLLASVILISLNRARKTAKDARIKSSVSQIATAAEMVHNDYNSYATTCNSTTEYGLDKLKSDITAQGGTLSCEASTDNYCFSALMNNGNYFCRYSTGDSKDNLSTNPCTAATSTCSS